MMFLSKRTSSSKETTSGWDRVWPGARQDNQTWGRDGLGEEKERCDWKRGDNRSSVDRGTLPTLSHLTLDVVPRKLGDDLRPLVVILVGHGLGLRG